MKMGHVGQIGTANAARVGRGSLTGRWKPRLGACSNIRGGITIERDLPANTRLWLTGWTKTIPGGRGRVAPGGDCRQRREAEPVIRAPSAAAERMRPSRADNDVVGCGLSRRR